jgi:uncharacterized radical SAM superfamily Fe-S cluster-containing enzyme
MGLQGVPPETPLWGERASGWDTREDLLLKAKRDADYIFYELTSSVCPKCLDTIDAQILLKGGRVIMRKRCATHGWFESLISSDAEMYLASLRYNKPGTEPLGFSTEVVDGCPRDCGLCPEHK